MRRIEESREILYVIRAIDVMMSSGVGLEAAMHTIGRGGYGVISEDFASVLERLQSGKSPGLEKELKKLMTNCETDGYRRLLNTPYNNLTQNTDVIESLKKLGSRMEEERSEAVKEYIEGLGGLPETMLSVGMLSPILISVLALAPQIVPKDLQGMLGLSGLIPLLPVITVGGLGATVLIMAFIGRKAHTTDPGL